jgi:hypothetical protein
MIDIEKGVPVPDTPHFAKYPWPDMEIGDSFVFPESLKRSTPYNLARTAGIRYGVKFVVKQRDGGPVRCWRIA